MTWITVAQAAQLAGRSPRTIYNWIHDGRLTARLDEHGVTRVQGRHVAEAEGKVRRGRPHGAPDSEPRRRSGEASSEASGRISHAR